MSAPVAVDQRAMSSGLRRAGRWQPLLLAVAGGLATETAFPAKSWWPMAYLGVFLLLLALRRDSARWAAVVGFIWGLAFFLPHLWWATEAVGQPIGWLALSASQAGAVAAFGAAWVWARRAPWVRRHTWLQVLTVAAVWVAVEQLRGSWPFGGFPWGGLAFSQTDAPLIGLAPVGGTVLVSAAVVVIAALAALAAARLRDLRTTRALIPLGLAAAVALLPSAVPLASASETGTLRVGAVQGNVSTRGAEAMSQARVIAANHAEGTRELMTQTGSDRLDLVLWPESASDIDPRTDTGVAETVDGAARAAGAPILLGTQRFVSEGRYNDYILWEPGSGARRAVSYTKQRPVPFGEYVPYRDFFRRITTAVDLVTTDMVAGTGSALLSVPVERLGRTVPITTAICFEVAFDDLIRRGVRAGGELIVIPTNNASFGMTQESTQQLAMSRFRAVEHGRAVVQVSTVGVSGIIGPDGSVWDQTGLFTAEQMAAELPLRTSLTSAAQLGAWPAGLAGLATLVAVLSGLAVDLRTRVGNARAMVPLRSGTVPARPYRGHDERP